MKKKYKLIATKYQPSPGKNPVIAQQPEIDSNRVFWSFARFDDFDAWKNATSGDIGYVCTVEHMRDLELKGWNAICANQDRDHPVTVPELVKIAQERLLARNLEEYDTLWSLHCNGTQRIWGIKSGQVLQVLWWDPYHRVCPITKKHT